VPEPSELRAAVDALDPEVRGRLAASWAQAALDEHASVASFSRFSLHLMAVGAPPELLEGAHRAAIDEIRHATLCFDLATVYADEPLSPGPLEMSGDVLGPLDLASVAAAAVIEGCVGETVATLEAKEALDRAGPTPVRNALAVIARDEARHAALAWRFVAWALEQGEPSVEAAVRGAFAACIDAPMGPEPAAEDDDDTLAVHGQLGARARYRLRREAAERVVRPTMDAMLQR
jgi:hypothetical protein